MNNKDILANRARKALQTLGVKLAIPQNPKDWKSFIVNLRVSYLGFSQEEFWNIIGLSRASGSKYESEGTSSSREVNRRLMLMLADALNLDWELPNSTSRLENLYISEPPEIQNKMLQMLIANNVSEKELAILLKLLTDLRRLNSERTLKN
jgi:transcriptional regulator with XRE-family HTH domain